MLQKVHLTIWDFAGGSEYYDVRTELYCDSDAIIFVFDLSSLNTFDNIQNWLEEINLHLNSSKNNNKTKKSVTTEYYLVGTKADIASHKKVDDKTEEYKKYCINNHINGLYYEISSTNPQQIFQLFNDIVTKTLINRKLL